MGAVFLPRLIFFTRPRQFFSSPLNLDLPDNMVFSWTVINNMESERVRSGPIATKPEQSLMKELLGLKAPLKIPSSPRIVIKPLKSTHQDIKDIVNSNSSVSAKADDKGKTPHTRFVLPTANPPQATYSPVQRPTLDGDERNIVNNPERLQDPAVSPHDSPGHLSDSPVLHRSSSFSGPLAPGSSSSSAFSLTDYTKGFPKGCPSLFLIKERKGSKYIHEGASNANTPGKRMGNQDPTTADQRSDTSGQSTAPNAF